tara:strand:+ start:151 stop:783 length:633 start_codon:yes stop_codon:yes gene_type:complete
MNISELISGKLPEIKKLLFTEETTTSTEATEETKELKFEDAKLVDGTIVRIEPAVEVGATVEVISEDGETLPAPDAEHELESGVIIRTEGGIIVEVNEPTEEAPAEEAAEEEEKEEEMSAEPFDSEKFKEDILGAVSELIKNEIAGAAFATSKKVDEVSEAVGMVTEIIEKMAATPKKSATKKVANPFNRTENSSDLAAKMAAVMSATKK